MRALLCWGGLLMAGPVLAEGALSARYADPTGVYGHGVVPGGEYLWLEIETAQGLRRFTFEDAVFEDTAPRVVDLDGDGAAEVVAVVSGFSDGARVQVFGTVDGAMAPVVANAPIGTRYRWLAIVGIADLDGDGAMEIAYVDRPHLAKTLRVLEVARDGASWTMAVEDSFLGVTNHRIGEPDIAGGLRDCGEGPEMLMASADWSRLLAVQYMGGFVVREIGQDTTRPAFAAALRCDG